MRQDGMVRCVLLRLRYVIRATSDHAEVSHTFRLYCTNRLRNTQGVRGDGEEPLDRLLPVFYEFRAGRFWGSRFDLLRVASRYDLPLFPLKQSSEGNPHVESNGNSRPPLH